MRKIPVFDGHNDLLARMDGEPEVDFFTGEKAKHISLGAMEHGGMFGGLFALFVPPTKEEEAAGTGEGGSRLPGPVPLDRARNVVGRQLSNLRGLVDRSSGKLRLAETAGEIVAAKEEGRIGVVAHMEGAEAISEGLGELEEYYELGLRSLGPVWSRHNRFGYGVPIYKEGAPDTAPGLTPAGKALVGRCRQLGVMVDLSHMSEQGFWDVARLSDAPLVASHSNAWSLCKSTRNLTDQQLLAIKGSGGVVGINFGTLFLRKDGKVSEDTPLSLIVDHLRYMADLIGVDHLALGSDFDGTVGPRQLGTAAGLPRLMAALGEAGFTPGEVEAIGWKNWVTLLEGVWGS